MPTKKSTTKRPATKSAAKKAAGRQGLATGIYCLQTQLDLGFQVF